MKQILRLGVAASCAIGLGVPLTHAASGSTSDKPEEITVTGSYIKRDNFDLASPVNVVAEIDIQLEATTNLGEVIFNQPANFGVEIAANQVYNGFSGGGIQTFSNLRGLGPDATMELLDGHRLLFGDANFSYPQIAIGRIETLLDGASALYGSEAIAGVVNYIPKKQYDGFEIQVDYQNLEEADAPRKKVAVLGGTVGERTSVLYAVELREQARLEMREFPEYLEASEPVNVLGAGMPGNFHVPRRSLTAAGTALVANSGFGAGTATAPTALAGLPTGTALVKTKDPGCANQYMNPAGGPVAGAALGTAQGLDGSLIGTGDVTVYGTNRWGTRTTSTLATSECRLNYSEWLDYQNPLHQIHGFARVEHKLSDFVTFQSEVLFGRQRFNTRQAPIVGVVGPALSTTAARGMLIPGEAPGNPFRAIAELPRMTGEAATVNRVNGLYEPQFGDRLLYAADTNNNGIPDRNPAARVVNGVTVAQATTLAAAERDTRYPVVLAAQPLRPRVTDPNNPFATADAVNGGIAFNEDVGFLDGVANTWHPFGKNLFGLPSFVKPDGHVPQKFENKQFRMSGGLDFEVPDTSWSGNATLVYGIRERDNPVPLQTNFSSNAMLRALTCVDPATMGCDYFNPFSTSQFRIVNRIPVADDPATTVDEAAVDQSSVEFNTSDEVNALATTNADNLDAEMRLIDIVFTGELFDVPAGAVAMAFGAHDRFEKERYLPDGTDQINDNLLGASFKRRISQLESRDYFFELNVPILDGERTGRLEAQVAGRQTNTDGRGIVGIVAESSFSDYVSKFALLYQPPGDVLSLRASFGEGFVVGSLLNLYGDPRTSSVRRADYTCVAIRNIPGIRPGGDNFFIQGRTGCAYTGTAASLTGTETQNTEQTLVGNPALKPERSDVYNVGFTLRLLDGDMTLQADYVTVEFENEIFSFTNAVASDVATILFTNFLNARNCPAAMDPVACALQARTDWITTSEDPRWTRDPASGQAPGEPPLGAIATFVGGADNAAVRTVKMLDVTWAYRFDIAQIPLVGADDLGFIQLRTQATYVDEWDYQPTPASSTFNGAGQRNDSNAEPPVPRWKVLQTIRWMYDDHTLALTGSYHHHVKDVTSGGLPRETFINSRSKIPSALYWDLTYVYGWEGLFGDGNRTEVTFGLKNIFDNKPRPIEDNGGVDLYLDGNRNWGRIYTIRLNQTL
jgi:outer membrane receptor protein involved in Fe transport